MVVLLASSGNDHSESGEIDQFQSLEYSRCSLNALGSLI